LYECFTANDCSRGFRVPDLYRTPEPLAVEMLTRIHESLATSTSDLAVGSTARPGARLPRDEQVAVLGPDNRIHVEGLSARLPDGHYTYDVRPLNRAQPRQFHLDLEKHGPFITLSIPLPGLYFVTLRDTLNMPRIDLFIAAVEPGRAVAVRKTYQDGAALMKDWNQFYLGWPVHDFQRAYLASLVLRPDALSKDGRTAATTSATSSARNGSTGEHRSWTAEPAFSPKPGIFDKEVAITLQSKTHGATIHFTVDGSEPVASSPVYRAPIIVKGFVLTVKAFASAAGKRDSPVVTGIFRIQE
jgi:hypothetical protein